MRVCKPCAIDEDAAIRGAECIPGAELGDSVALDRMGGIGPIRQAAEGSGLRIGLKPFSTMPWEAIRSGPCSAAKGSPATDQSYHTGRASVSALTLPVGWKTESKKAFFPKVSVGCPLRARAERWKAAWYGGPLYRFYRIRSRTSVAPELLRRYAPRNDTPVSCHCERSEAISGDKICDCI